MAAMLTRAALWARVSCAANVAAAAAAAAALEAALAQQTAAPPAAAWQLAEGSPQEGSRPTSACRRRNLALRRK